jgi:hypothetical protein
MLKLELLYHYSVRRYNVSCMGPEGHEGSGVRTLLVLRRISSRIVLEFERRTSSRALANAQISSQLLCIHASRELCPLTDSRDQAEIAIHTPRRRSRKAAGPFRPVSLRRVPKRRRILCFYNTVSARRVAAKASQG